MQVNDQQLIDQLATAVRQAAQVQPAWTSNISAISAMIATISALLSILFFIRSQKNTRDLAREARLYKLLPMIVFYRRAERVWTLKNVGEGTAVKLVVRNYLATGQVRDEVTLYPVAPGEEIRLDYIKGPAVKLVARYVNIVGQDPHFTVCSEDINEINVGEFMDGVALPFAKGHESQIDQWPVTRLSNH